MNIGFTLKGTITGAGERLLWVNGQQILAKDFATADIFSADYFAWGYSGTAPGFTAFAALTKICGSERIALYNALNLERELSKLDRQQSFEREFSIQVDAFPSLLFLYPNQALDPKPIQYSMQLESARILYEAANSQLANQDNPSLLTGLLAVNEHIAKRSSNEKITFAMRVGDLKALYNSALRCWQQKQRELQPDPGLEAALEQTCEILQRRMLNQ